MNTAQSFFSLYRKEIMKKNIIEYIIGITFAIATIWLILFTAPKIKELYFPTDEITEIKTDTVISTDTLYLTRIMTDTLPTTKYVTITEHDTLYRVVGDSIEQTPRVLRLKKKLYQTPLQWRDKILWSTRHM